MIARKGPKCIFSLMNPILIKVGSFSFKAELQVDLAPQTCAAFQTLLPYKQKLIQARWSGESGWIPLGAFRLEVGLENAKRQPAPGQILFYQGSVSEAEILFPYGKTDFACKHGPLAGSHFLTITEDLDQLSALGDTLLWKGAQEIIFSCVG